MWEFQKMFERGGPPHHKKQSRDSKPISSFNYLKGIVLKSEFLGVSL